ncbi:hypothetical protein [Microbacterium sp.]|uniref:hypothetical protein n=1 Tax=Microbacterium sp. TaxID=51671 RepID=UPI003F72F6C7
MNESDFILEGFDERNPTYIRRGVYAGYDSGFALVDMGSSRFSCDFAGYIPVVGDPVQVVSTGSRHTLLPLGAKPAVGTVLTVSSPTCSLQTVAGPITAIIGGSAPTSGDRVQILWGEDGPTTGLKLATTVIAPEPPPNPGGGGAGAVHTLTFKAIDAGSTDRPPKPFRWWTPNPRAGNTTYGAWFYGPQIKDTIPPSATLIGLKFKVNRIQDSGGAPNFAAHNLMYKNAMPTMAGDFAWDPPNGWQDFPFAADFFAHLKTGGGIGLNQGGNNIFANLAQDSESGAVRISWRT